MKVFRIWNETAQEWLTTNKTIWLSKSNANRAIAFIKQHPSYKTLTFKIFQYELTNEVEIKTE